MHDSGFMCTSKAGGDLRDDIESFGQVEFHAAQGLAVHQFTDDIGDAVFIANVIDRDDVGMIERRDSVRLNPETLAASGIAGYFGKQNLQCDFAAKPGIARAVDLAHPAGAKQDQDFVRAQASTAGERHGNPFDSIPRRRHDGPLTFGNTARHHRKLQRSVRGS